MVGKIPLFPFTFFLLELLSSVPAGRWLKCREEKENVNVEKTNEV